MCNNRIFEDIDDLITAVYRSRILNPWEEGPERSAAYENLFREKFSDWPIRNQTDLVHGSATVIAFLLHPGHYIGVTSSDGFKLLIKRLGGMCYHALLEISHIGPYARIRFTRETIEDGTNGINYSEQNVPYRTEDWDFHLSLVDFLGDEGIEVLNDDVLSLPVPDVELDVTGIGEATVYHCLFDEE